MTEAFKRGYMDKMAELRKLAEGEDDVVSPILSQGRPNLYIAQSAADQGVGLHQPVTAAQVGAALRGPQFRSSVLRDLSDSGISSEGLSLFNEAAMQNYLDTTGQKPSERMPTPYELMQYAAAMDGKGESESPAFSEEGNTAFQAALMNPESGLSEEVLRRLWAGSTNAVPIAAVSPVSTNPPSITGPVEAPTR